MSDTAIADVGEVLITLLRDNMGIPPASIMLISPGEIEANDNARLSLFLYQVRENAYLRNQEMQQISSTHLKYPPLPLELYYMLTAYPSSGIADRTERTKEEHGILGKAIQIMYDNTMLALDYGLRITLNTMSLDDMTKIWTTFQGKSYRPSACYLVTPVMIESKLEMGMRRVTSKEMDNDVMVEERGT